MRKIIVYILLSVVITSSLHAQLGTHWRKIRHEAVFGFGATSFLGELGGANQEGTHFVRDFEFKATKGLFEVGYRYKMAEHWAFKTAIWYGYVSGADSLTLETHRNSRNLSFRSPIVELTANIEYSIFAEKYGHRYDLRRVKGKRHMPNVYLFTGISGFYFNPKAKYTDGKWHALQPLGTEGQGRVSTREKYNRIALAVPVGIGMNHMLDRNWGIGGEIGFRYTFTDYIDDVSTTYVDSNLFNDDPIAQYFHDRSNGWNGSGRLNQRGDNLYNDFYMFLSINASYKIRPRHLGMPKF
ncbi:MAG: hypothetical protein GX879_09780 [Bacteroidales bacterium]|nr:hypothetical protein [Bacteroidales bacterium]